MLLQYTFVTGWIIRTLKCQHRPSFPLPPIITPLSLSWTLGWTSRANGLCTCAGDDALEGVVMDYSSQWVRVAVPHAVAGHLQGQPWRLDQYANTTAHER